MAAILKTIRTIESGDNYKIKNPHSSASGAYQFLDTTWGKYKGYLRASDAPKDVQDEKAAQNALAILQKHGNDVKWVPAAWYAGNAGAMKLDWDTVLPGNRSSINQYVNKWMELFVKERRRAGSAFTTTSPPKGGPSMPIVLGVGIGLLMLGIVIAGASDAKVEW